MRYAVIDLHKLRTAADEYGEDGVGIVHNVIKAAAMPTMSRLMNAAPGMLAALKEIEPLYYCAHKAYQFGAGHYTYEALAALTSARVKVERVLNVAGGRGWHI